MPKDLLGRTLAVGDLIAWGHSGRHAGTRLGRIYRCDPGNVRAFCIERGPRHPLTGKRHWAKGGHAAPHGPVKIDDTDCDVPTLDQLDQL